MSVLIVSVDAVVLHNAVTLMHESRVEAIGAPDSGAAKIFIDCWPTKLNGLIILSVGEDPANLVNLMRSSYPSAFIIMAGEFSAAISKDFRRSLRVHFLPGQHRTDNLIEFTSRLLDIPAPIASQPMSIY